MNRYIITCRETHYVTYVVHAESEEHIRSGNHGETEYLETLEDSLDEIIDIDLDEEEVTA